MTKAIFYHAGCPVCISAEKQLLSALDPKLAIEVVHLGEQKSRVEEASSAGVASVPALVLDGNVLHINFGASLEALKEQR